MMGPRNFQSQDAGLAIHDLGLQGQVVEVAAGFQAACRRHDQVVDLVDRMARIHEGPPGGRLILQLVCNELVLSLRSLNLATSVGSIYRWRSEHWIEWMQSGWIDRRKLSPATTLTVLENGGCRVHDSDWRWVALQLGALHSFRAPNHAIHGFIVDAQAWWHQHAPVPLLLHATGTRPYQLLPRSALARSLHVDLRDARGDQAGDEASATFHGGHDWARYACTRNHTRKTEILDGLIAHCGRVARSRRSKDEGRRIILEYIDAGIHLAEREGRAQVMLLGAIRHAVMHGGMRGEAWAAVTIYEYVRTGIKELLDALLGRDLDALTGPDWYSLYAELMARARSSQRGKFAAFVEALHRFFVICGFDPLPLSLFGAKSLAPPCASVIWPHELQRALAYVEVQAPTPRIALQGKVGLLLAYWIPLRSIELWCIRVDDFCPNDPMYLSIYPRRRDGVGKSPSLRRQEDIRDPQLAELLLDLWRLRCHDDGRDGLLLGEPGMPEGRHAEGPTIQLMNTALKWATGDPDASYYDLRHSVFSRRFADALSIDAETTDVSIIHQVSAQGGHAGPESTRPYIHHIEPALFDVSRQARPIAFVSDPVDAVPSSQIGDIGDGLLVMAPDTPRKDKTSVDEDPASMDLLHRAEIIWKIAQGYHTASVAGTCSTTVPAVQKVVESMVNAMVFADVINPTAIGTHRKNCIAVSAFGLWARAARQPKCSGLAHLLETFIAAEQWSRLHLHWSDWLLCRSGEFISLANPRPAIRVVELLLAANISTRSMVVKRAKGSAPLPHKLEDLRLPVCMSSDRRGRAPHRLFFSEPGTDATQAKAASLSVVGLHWWMLLLGSALISKGVV